MVDHVRYEVKFCLDICDEPTFQGLLAHLKTFFESYKTFAILISEFHTHFQCGKESEDNFGNDLQILSWKEAKIALKSVCQFSE